MNDKCAGATLEVPPARPIRYLSGIDPYSRQSPCKPTPKFRVLALACACFWTKKESERRDLNPRPSLWESDTLPLSYSRSIFTIEHCDYSRSTRLCQDLPFSNFRIQPLADFNLRPTHDIIFIHRDRVCPCPQCVGGEDPGQGQALSARSTSRISGRKHGHLLTSIDLFSH
jgi:hypothetical protein